ncbi:MAG: ABC transporter ATP-binding protein [Hyphomicrobiaceae bacterium]
MSSHDPAGQSAAGAAGVVPGSASPGLELIGINKRFGQRWGARDLNLAVPRGKLLVLLGPSGSGKSTTLNIIAGFTAPDSGRVLVEGQDLTAVPTHRRNFGMVFQANTLFPHLTMEENILYGLSLRKVPAAEQKSKLTRMLEMIGLSGREASYPAQLSGGEQQRVALARALVLAPRLLLLDEPLSALDTKLRRQIRDDIRAIQLRHGITAVMVTHDQEEALAIGDIVAVMDQGALQQIDTPERIYRNPANAFVAGFVGENNLLEGTLVDMAGGMASVRLADGVVVQGAAPKSKLVSGARVLLVLRPDSIEATPVGNGRGAAMLAGEVAVVQFLGAKVRYIVEVQGSGRRINIDSPLPVRLNAGDRVELGWPSGEALVLAAEAAA